MRRSALCIELHYLANLEFFTRLINSKRVTLEVSDYFMKQTYRNRCYIMGPNGIQVLTVPVHYHKKSIFRDVTIDYHQNWVKDHRKAVQAAYGKAPFFDYFYDLFDQIWDPTENDPDSFMPPFGKHGAISKTEINKIIEYLYTL